MMSLIIINTIVLLTLFFLVSWLFVSLVIYFVPLIIAHIRRHNNIGAIAILNIVLGWTFVGWLAALLWALNRDISEENDYDD